jgi:hypothetical protein
LQSDESGCTRAWLTFGFPSADRSRGDAFASALLSASAVCARAFMESTRRIRRKRFQQKYFSQRSLKALSR